MSDFEVQTGDSTATIVGENPGSSNTTAFFHKLKGHVLRSDSHIYLEFLREVTRTTVGTDSSKFEPVNVSSLKVVELEAGGFSTSNLSGTSKLGVVLNTVSLLSDILSVP